ncbi:MAG TPA: hypothetical protein VLL97_15240 [Acidobacteriota bacterium]|nr:hypothetical protein [Acidobacteriota bacterium]
MKTSVGNTAAAQGIASTVSGVAGMRRAALRAAPRPSLTGIFIRLHERISVIPCPDLLYNVDRVPSTTPGKKTLNPD